MSNRANATKYLASPKVSPTPYDEDRPSLLDKLLGRDEVQGGPKQDAQGNIVPGLYSGSGGFAKRKAASMNQGLNAGALQNQYEKALQEIDNQHELAMENARTKNAEHLAIANATISLLQQAKLPLTPQNIQLYQGFAEQQLQLQKDQLGVESKKTFIKSKDLDTSEGQNAVTAGSRATDSMPATDAAKKLEMTAPMGSTVFRPNPMGGSTTVTGSLQKQGVAGGFVDPKTGQRVGGFPTVDNIPGSVTQSYPAKIKASDLSGLAFDPTAGSQGFTGGVFGANNLLNSLPGANVQPSPAVQPTPNIYQDPVDPQKQAQDQQDLLEYVRQLQQQQQNGADANVDPTPSTDFNLFKRSQNGGVRTY